MAADLFEATFNVSSYTAWLLAKPSHAHAFRWHRRVLQLLQRREQHERAPGAAEPPAPRRWVLKTPWHLAVLDDLLREYPDALVIHTHRAPASVVGSSASVHAKMYGAGSDAVDLRAIGREQLEMLEEMVRRGMVSRARWEREEGGALGLGARVADVHLDELKAAPLATVARVYETLGLTLTDGARRDMETWLGGRQVRHGGDAFALADFGLSREQIGASAVFRRYCELYQVRGCD